MGGGGVWLGALLEYSLALMWQNYYSELLLLYCLYNNYIPCTIQYLFCMLILCALVTLKWKHYCCREWLHHASMNDALFFQIL